MLFRSQVREYNRGRIKLTRYPTTPDGQFGISTINVTNFIFIEVFSTIFLREHNRLCEEFYATYGGSWSDEKYFQEARRWVIAYIQKITYFEYRKLIFACH